MDIVPSQTPAAQSRQRAGLATFPCFAQASCVQQAKAPSIPPQSQDLRASGGPKASSSQLLCLPVPQLSQSLAVLESKGSGCPMGH